MTVNLGQRVLGRSGFRVSNGCLGTMTFGTGWGEGFGADEAVCREIYAAFRQAGGNFVDTANQYTNGQSEEIVGRLIRSERDAIVLSTKFTLPAGSDVNSGGSHRKSLRNSIEASLSRLGTDYVDVLYIHAWDQLTPVEDTLRALDDLITMGKILAIGVSNMPAWTISRVDLLAELRGWTQFCTMQVAYSLVERTPDRELLPMANSLGISVLAWSPLARGLLTGKPRPAGVPPVQPAVQAVVDIAAKIGADIGRSAAQVALAWLWSHGVMPIIGARSSAQILDNLAAFDVQLTADQMAQLDAISAVPLGYPHEFLRDLFPQFAPVDQPPGK
jgi:aryl-alcohol dehydrogenase-like predicted oxidoreductase